MFGLPQSGCKTDFHSFNTRLQVISIVDGAAMGPNQSPPDVSNTLDTKAYRLQQTPFLQ